VVAVLDQEMTVLVVLHLLMPYYSYARYFSKVAKFIQINIALRILANTSVLLLVACYLPRANPRTSQLQ